MRVGWGASPVAAALLLAWTLSTVSDAKANPSAAEPGCPNVELIYARGTGEEPGLGPVGQQFVDALHARLGEKSLAVYPVNYPASDDWPTAIDGVRDASAHIQSAVAACPETRLVLGGWSQGAAVTAFTTANTAPDALPDGLDPAAVPKPMPPEVADHVSAVVLFAMPNDRAMNFLGQPPIVIGPLYTAKTVELCVEGDVICSQGLDLSIHDPVNYHQMVDQGATFAADRLQA
ncbi:MAG TPA: cutinase family protein [Mycobacterium sp.]|nr:cutinase family protein [Mycobacterium sp.]